MICDHVFSFFFFSSRRRHTRCALVTGVQTCALPILCPLHGRASPEAAQDASRADREHALCPAQAGLADGTAILSCNGAYRRRNSGECAAVQGVGRHQIGRSEEHTSELQSLMRLSYAVFCLKKTKQHTQRLTTNNYHHKDNAANA